MSSHYNAPYAVILFQGNVTKATFKEFIKPWVAVNALTRQQHA